MALNGFFTSIVWLTYLWSSGAYAKEVSNSPPRRLGEKLLKANTRSTYNSFVSWSKAQNSEISWSRLTNKNDWIDYSWVSEAILKAKSIQENRSSVPNIA